MVLSLSVGVNGDLSFAESDARRVFEYFSQSSLAPPCAVARGLTGEDATVQGVVGALSQFIHFGNPSSTFVFYSSRHGDPEGIRLTNGILLYDGAKANQSGFG